MQCKTQSNRFHTIHTHTERARVSIVSFVTPPRGERVGPVRTGTHACIQYALNVDDVTITERGQTEDWPTQFDFVTFVGFLFRRTVSGNWDDVTGLNAISMRYRGCVGGWMDGLLHVIYTMHGWYCVDEVAINVRW